MLLQIRAKLRHFSSSFSSCANSMAQSCHPSPAHPAALFSLPARRFLLLIAARSCCIFYAISYFIWMCFFFVFLLFLCCFGIPPHSHHIHIRTQVYHIVFLVMFCLTLFFSFWLMRVRFVFVVYTTGKVLYSSEMGRPKIS